jgi:hypothetical protein
LRLDVRWWLFRVAGFGLVNYTASLSRVFLIAKGAYRSITPGEFSNIKKPAKKKRKYNKIKEHHNALIKKAKGMMTMGFEPMLFRTSIVYFGCET